MKFPNCEHPNKRSASFHYPDGTSRITHSVYSSEEDFNDDEDDDEPRLYEVNDDELFLAYDSGGVVAPRRHVGSNRLVKILFQVSPIDGKQKIT